jgi:hypothetical protein
VTEHLLTVPRLVWLAWRRMPVRGPIRRWLICAAGRVCDDNLVHLD